MSATKVKIKPPRNKKALLVAVAKDVLKLMRVLDVKTSYGYLMRKKPRGFDKENYYADATIAGNSDKIQQAIPKIAKECTVCARGAMMLGYIHLYDGHPMIPTNQEAQLKTLDLFGMQAKAIERAFERGKTISYEDIPRLADKDAKGRLRWIMRNIIQHDGVFTPLEKKAKPERGA